MLVISRKKGQRIFINGKEIILTVLHTDGQLVELGFDADASIPINREEREKQHTLNHTFIKQHITQQKER